MNLSITVSLQQKPRQNTLRRTIQTGTRFDSKRDYPFQSMRRSNENYRLS